MSNESSGWRLILRVVCTNCTGKGRATALDLRCHTAEFNVTRAARVSKFIRMSINGAPRGSLVFFDGKIVELTSYHIHIPIDTLLAMTDRELTETLTPGDGVELRAMLVCLKASGKTVFTGSSCDRLGADGACLGHRRG